MPLIVASAADDDNDDAAAADIMDGWVDVDGSEDRREMDDDAAAGMASRTDHEANDDG